MNPFEAAADFLERTIGHKYSVRGGSVAHDSDIEFICFRCGVKIYDEYISVAKEDTPSQIDSRFHKHCFYEEMKQRARAAGVAEIPNPDENQEL